MADFVGGKCLKYKLLTNEQPLSTQICLHVLACLTVTHLAVTHPQLMCNDDNITRFSWRCVDNYL